MEYKIKCPYCKFIIEELPFADHMDFWNCSNCEKEFVYYPVTSIETQTIEDYEDEIKTMENLLKNNED
jgi:DNA-directed RNA polymerase subunit RPC12/RpoP